MVKIKQPFFIVAEDITGEALQALVVNKNRGVLDVVAIKAPGFGDRRKALLQDLAIATGATCVLRRGGGGVRVAMRVVVVGARRRVDLDGRGPGVRAAPTRRRGDSSPRPSRDDASRHARADRATHALNSRCAAAPRARPPVRFAQVRREGSRHLSREGDAGDARHVRAHRRRQGVVDDYQRRLAVGADPLAHRAGAFSRAALFVVHSCFLSFGSECTWAVVAVAARRVSVQRDEELVRVVSFVFTTT